MKAHIERAMTRLRIEEQIRRYTETIDFIAAPVEDLIPAEMASRLEIETRPNVDVRVSLGPPLRRRRLPGWAYGLTAAAVVLLLAIPVWLLVSDPVDDVAATSSPTTTVSIPPVESTDPFLRAENGGVVTGSGWLPSSPVSFSVNGFEGEDSHESDSAGRFNFNLASIGLGLDPGDTLISTDGTSTRQMTIPDLTVDTFDPDRGVASGTASLADGTLVELRIPASGDDGLLLQIQTTGPYEVRLGPCAQVAQVILLPTGRASISCRG